MGKTRSTHSPMPLSESLGDRDRAASSVRFACWTMPYHSQPAKGLSRTRRLTYSGGLVRSGLLCMPMSWSKKASVLDYLHWNRDMLHCWQVLIPNDSRVPVFPGLCNLGLGLASPECQHRTQILWQSSIILL